MLLVALVFVGAMVMDGSRRKQEDNLSVGSMEIHWQGFVYQVSASDPAYPALKGHMMKALQMTDSVCKCGSEPLTTLMDRNQSGVVLKLQKPLKASMPANSMVAQKTEVDTLAVRFTPSNDAIAAGRELLSQYQTSRSELAAMKKVAERFVDLAERSKVHVKNQFKIQIETDKKVYSTDEKIQISARFTYIGDKPEMRIYHSMNYVFFEIRNEKTGFVTEIAEPLPLRSTVLPKDKEFAFPYTKSGSYSENDPKADFWRKFFADPELHLPPGEYHIKAFASFSTDKDKLQETSLYIPVETIIQVAE